MLFTYEASGKIGASGSADHTRYATYWSYEATGSIKARNCGKIVEVTYLPRCIYNFSPGDEAWLKYRAEKGKLEKIVVKKVKLITTFMYQGKGECTVMYFDTFNAAYNSDELITYAEALAIANNYKQRRLIEAARAACIQ